MSIFKKFIAAQTAIWKTPENTKVLPENEIHSSPKVSIKTSTTNQTVDIPHYLQSVIDELETSKSNCKKSP